MQTSTSVTMLLLLLLTVVTEVRPQMAAAAAAEPAAGAGPPAAEWVPYGVQETKRGFRFGGADRFSHGFGRRRRVDDVELTNPLAEVPLDSGRRMNNPILAMSCVIHVKSLVHVYTTV